MGVFHFLIASLTALLTSFPAFSPGPFHGLVPWIGFLSTPPPTPTPSALPTGFSVPHFWEEIPWANLSALDVPVPPSTPTPMRTVSLVFDEDEPLVEPQAEEPTAEALLREIWWLLKQIILHLTLNLNKFIRENPYLPPPPPKPTPRADQSRPPSRADHLRLLREQRDIRELKQRVKELTLRVEQMRRHKRAPALYSPQLPPIARGQPLFPTQLSLRLLHLP